MRTSGTKFTFALALLLAGALIYSAAAGAVFGQGGPAFGLASGGRSDVAAQPDRSVLGASPDAPVGSSSPVGTPPSSTSGSLGGLSPAAPQGGTLSKAGSGGGSSGGGGSESPPRRSPDPEAPPVPPPAGEPLVVVTPAILALKALSGGVPSLFQVGSSLVVARLVDLLPPQVVGPILEGYQQAVDAVTTGQIIAADLLTAVAEGTEPLGAALNPLLRPVLVALVEAVATSLEGVGELLAGTGVDTSFASYAATALGTLVIALGIR